MKKVVIYSRNKNIRPSDYYRIIQYTKKINAEITIRSAVPNFIDRWCLDSVGKKCTRILSLFICYFCIIINFIVGFILDIVQRPDKIIVIREIFPRVIPPFFKYLLKKKCQKVDFIWDFDDSIISAVEISKSEAEIYLNNAKHIIVSTPYLKNSLPKFVKNKTDVLCTTDGDLANIDLNEINSIRKDVFINIINVVWVATSSNLPNLLDIVDFFEIAAKKIKKEHGKELHLKVVCNKKVEKDFEFLKVDNIQWTHDVALKEILSAHIGIMPLMNNEFALGKAGFKLIQYMAGGLPVIASSVGFNSSILNGNIGFCVEQNSEKQWVKAIVELSKDYTKWEKFSLNSRREWEEKYSYQSHLDFWNKLINE